MSGSNLKIEEFKIVSYKKNKLKVNQNNNKFVPIINSVSSKDFNLESAVRRIEAAKQELITSDIYSSILASLREGLHILNSQKITEIVCFGLGKIGECMIARYQLALLLFLKDLYHTKVVVYDPIFNDNDIEILKYYSLTLLGYNTEGKYRLLDKSTTLFYLPHCPKQLSNNLLWANWGLLLNYCIIIANSFTNTIESHSKRHITENADYILNISPFVTELPIINSFKYYDIFNDMAIHVFPINNLSLISEDLWKYHIEPKYSDEEVEFISNSQFKEILTLSDSNN